MDKKLKNKLIIGGALLSGAALLLLHSNNTAATSTTDVTLPTGPQLPTTTPNVYPLVYNTYHPQLKLLQAALSVPQDGIVGPVTLAEWKKYDSAITKYFQIPSPVALQKTIDGINRAKQTTTGSDVVTPALYYGNSSDVTNVAGVKKCLL